MYRILPLVVVALGWLNTATSCADEPPEELTKALTSGTWAKVLGSAIPVDMREYHVYRFAKDGSYSYRLLSDYTTSASGRWQLVTEMDGAVRLQLKDQKGQKEYYWLGPDSMIRYEPKKDALVVTGKRYVGDQTLERYDGKLGD